MKKILIVLSFYLIVTLGGCKDLVVEKSTGLYQTSYDVIFPPDSIHIKKEKDSWYSFERKGKKYLVYYRNSLDNVTIMDY